MGNSIHGINGLIYVSGSELTGANSWNIQVDPDTVQTIDLGVKWKDTHKGAKGWSGNINAWEKEDQKLLMDAALADGAVSLIIYPNRNTMGNYYNGNAIFGASTDGGATSAVSKNGSFTGDGALSQTGFS